MTEEHFFDEAFKELKDKGMATTEDIKNLRDSVIESNYPVGNKQEAFDFLDHLKTCTDVNCTMHKTKTELQNNSWYRGFILGMGFAKKNRK